MKKKTPATKKPAAKKDDTPHAQMPVAMLERLVQDAFQAGYVAASRMLAQNPPPADIGKTTVAKLLESAKK